MDAHNNSPTKPTPFINEKLTNGNSPQKAFPTPEEIWDRTPMISRMNSMECWDYTIELECLNGPQDLQLAAELGKTLLERNKELETLLRTHQRKCEDQRQEIEYLTKQNITLREVNASRLQIYETLDTSIQDLEYEKHRLLVENSGDKKLIKNLNQTIESLELRCDDLTKQVDEMGRYLDQERRKNEKILENSTTAPVALSTTKQPQSLRHRSDGSGSASEPESEEASTTPTNPSKIFSSDSSSIHTSSQLVQMTFLNYSHDLSSIQPIYSIDSSSHDSGFKTGSCSNSAEHEELLKVITELEETKQQFMNEHMTVAELEQQLSVLAQENQKLQSKLVQSNTLDEMRSVHEELSFLEEVRQGQMCTRCLKTFDDRMVPTENTSYIGTEGDDDDRSLMDLLNHATTQDSPPTYRSAVTIKDDENSSLPEIPSDQFNPYKELVEKYEALLEVQRNSRSKQHQQQQISLQDELMNSGDFSSFNTKSSSGARHKTPDFSELETSSSGFSDETSTKATQTDDSTGSFLFSIADGEDCKFTIYDDAAPIDSRFRDRPKYRDLFKEIFTVLKKAAENKDEGEKLPLLEDDKHAPEETSKVPPVTPTTEEMPCDFDVQSIMSSVISQNSIAISECITKTERKKAKSHKKQAAKEEIENKPPVVQMVGGKLVTPYNRMALDLMALNAKKKARRSRHRSKDKYSSGGRDSSVCSNASSTMNQSIPENHVLQEKKVDDECDSSTLTRNKKGNRSRDVEVFQAFSTLGSSDWNGDTITVYNRNAMKVENPEGFFCRPPIVDNTSEIKFKHSAASHELKKLKKLDMSYAEVLRQADKRQRRWK